MPIRTLHDCEDLFEQNLVREVEARGWSIVHSPAGHGQETDSAYTVGLWHRHGHPECLVVGLPSEKAHALLTAVAEDVAAGRRFQSSESYPELLEHYACRFAALDRSYHKPYLGYCRWFYRGDEFTAQQLLWPDAEGRFPDEASFDPALSPLQPSLA